MVWSKIEMGEKIRAQYALFNVSYRKFEGKLLSADLDCLYGSAVTWNGSAVGSFEANAVWTSEFLGEGGRDDRYYSTAVN